MGNMNPALVADMKFAMLLREEKSKGKPIPVDPVGVHIILRLLQVNRGLSSGHYSGIEICKQDTDLTSSEIINSCSEMARSGLIELIDQDTFRLTPLGLDASKLVESLRERSYREPIKEGQSIWEKDISGYLIVIGAIVGIILYFAKK